MLATILPLICLAIGFVRAFTRPKPWQPKTDHERLYAAYNKEKK